MNTRLKRFVFVLLNIFFFLYSTTLGELWLFVKDIVATNYEPVYYHILLLLFGLILFLIFSIFNMDVGKKFKLIVCSLFFAIGVFFYLLVFNKLINIRIFSLDFILSRSWYSIAFFVVAQISIIITTFFKKSY